MPPSFDQLFRTALGSEAAPYDYQCRLACREEARANAPETLLSGSECHARLINIPTGLGKTTAVVLTWAWKRPQPWQHHDTAHRALSSDPATTGCRIGKGQSYRENLPARRMGRGEDGHESYTRGVLRLLDHYGPFRLACFEAIFRATNIRASIRAKSIA